MTTAMVSLQWNPFSDYMQTPTGRVEVEKGFQNSLFSIHNRHQSIRMMNLAKLILKRSLKKYLNGQKTNLLFEAGFAIGDIP
jgi:hypothetical protein